MNPSDVPNLVRPLTFDNLDSCLDEVAFDDLDDCALKIINLDAEAHLELKQLFLAHDWSSAGNRQSIRWSSFLEPLFAHACRSAAEMSELYFNLTAVCQQKMTYRVDEAARVWIGENRSQASDLMELISNSRQGAPLVISCVEALKALDVNLAIDHLSALFSAEGEATRRNAIWALGLFRVDEVALPERVIDLFSELLSSSAELELSQAISAYFRSDPEGTIEVLVDMVRKLFSTELPAVRCELIDSWSANEAALKNCYKAEARELMGRVLESDQRSAMAVDFALSKLDFDEDREFCFEVLRNFFMQDSADSNIERFQSTAHKLATSSDGLLIWYSVQFLLTGEVKLGELASSLFPPLCESTYEFEPGSLGLSDKEIPFLVRKVFAYLTNDNGPAVSILVGCLKASKPEKITYISSLISDFWLYNYPTDIEHFKKLMVGDKALLNLVEAMSGKIDSYNAALSALPDNKALRPSVIERRVQAEIGLQRNRDVQKASHKGGIMELIGKKQTLLYGSASLHYMGVGGQDDMKPQLTHLQSHSFSMKLPRMLKLSPAWFEYLLWTYRSERRPDAASN